MGNPASKINGSNPMRWDCDKRGCFNIKRRPKIEVFCGCFPGRISFGDVDGIVEINGYGLMLEWKSDTTKPTTGQRIMYERITKNKLITVLLVVGNAETMEVSHYGIFFQGIQTPLIKANLDDVKTRIKKWVIWAKSQ
jgi:hypothetical protein